MNQFEQMPFRDNTKDWTTWLARGVGLLEMLIGVGISLLGVYAIFSGIIDLDNAPETILGDQLTGIFGGIFLVLMGAVVLVGLLVLFVGWGMWQLSSGSWWVNIIVIILFLGNRLLSFSAAFDLYDLLPLVLATTFGLYLFLIKSKFN